MKTISMSTCIAQFRTPCRQPMLIAFSEDDGEREGEGEGTVRRGLHEGQWEKRAGDRDEDADG